MRNPTMPQIRQAIAQARALDGLEDTQQFALEAPALLARLVEILDLYVGHEPTVAEEAAYARAEIERRDTAISEALRLLESAPEAFLGASQNIVAAAHLLRQANEAEPGQQADIMQYGIRFADGRVQPVGGDREYAALLLPATRRASDDPTATLVQRAINAGPWTETPADGGR